MVEADRGIEQPQVEVNSADYVIPLEKKYSSIARQESLDVPGWNIWTEEYTSPNTGLSGVVAHFGEKIKRAQMDGIIIQKIIENPQSQAEGWIGPVGYSTGFGDIYRAPEDATREEKDAATFEVALKLAQQALKLKGWNPEDIDIVDFANSAADVGMSEILKEKLITKLGFREETEVTGTFLACDGAGNALYKRLLDPESRGKKVLLLTVDSVGSEMPLDPDQADTNSMQIFSNGAASFAFEPGKDLSLIVGKTEVHEDTGALNVITRYDKDIQTDATLTPEDPTGLLRRIKNELMIRTPKSLKKFFDMNGSATAKFFFKHAVSNVQAVYEEYQKLYPGKVINHTTTHHPSYPVFKGLKHALDKRKVNLNFNWLVPEGNSSGATSLISFIRTLPKFNPGDHNLYISFGAGGSFTSFVAEIG